MELELLAWLGLIERLRKLTGDGRLVGQTGLVRRGGIGGAVPRISRYGAVTQAGDWTTITTRRSSHTSADRKHRGRRQRERKPTRRAT